MPEIYLLLRSKVRPAAFLCSGSGFSCDRLRMPRGQTNTEHYEKNSDRGGRRADRLRADDISARPVRRRQRRGGRCPRVPRAERDGTVRRAERARSACLRLYGQQVQGRYDFQPGRAAERRGRERPSAGVEYQHGGTDELARHRPPVRLARCSLPARSARSACRRPRSVRLRTR